MDKKLNLNKGAKWIVDSYLEQMKLPLSEKGLSELKENLIVTLETAPVITWNPEDYIKETQKLLERTLQEFDNFGKDLYA